MILDNSNPSAGPAADSDGTAGKEDDGKANQDLRDMSPQGRYVKLDELLGSGAYKDVYRAYDTHEGMEVAWNVVKLSRVPPSERKRIKTEVKLLRDIEHEHVMKYYNSWVDREKEQIVFVTEIMSSGSLKDYLRKNSIIRWNAVKRWCRQILHGLDFLHSKKIIHRDIKCDNIFINGATGDVRIGDLGLSTRISDERQLAVRRASVSGGGSRGVVTTTTMTCLGTPEFMAPELYEESYDEKVDIYAFGMTILEMVSGRMPYHDCTSAAQIYRKVAKGELPSELNLVSNVNARSFICSCLQPHDVRPSAGELLSDESFLSVNAEEDFLEVRVKLLLQPLAYTIGSPKTGGYGGANPIQAILEEGEGSDEEGEVVNEYAKAKSFIPLGEEVDESAPPATIPLSMFVSSSMDAVEKIASPTGDGDIELQHPDDVSLGIGVGGGGGGTVAGAGQSAGDDRHDTFQQSSELVDDPVIAADNHSHSHSTSIVHALTAYDSCSSTDSSLPTSPKAAPVDSGTLPSTANDLLSTEEGSGTAVSIGPVGESQRQQIPDATGDSAVVESGQGQGQQQSVNMEDIVVPPASTTAQGAVIQVHAIGTVPSPCTTTPLDSAVSGAHGQGSAVGEGPMNGDACLPASSAINPSPNPNSNTVSTQAISTSPITTTMHVIIEESVVTNSAGTGNAATAAGPSIISPPVVPEAVPLSPMVKDAGAPLPVSNTYVIGVVESIGDPSITRITPSSTSTSSSPAKSTGESTANVYHNASAAAPAGTSSHTPVPASGATAAAASTQQPQHQSDNSPVNYQLGSITLHNLRDQVNTRDVEHLSLDFCLHVLLLMPSINPDNTAPLNNSNSDGVLLTEKTVEVEFSFDLRHDEVAIVMKEMLECEFMTNLWEYSANIIDVITPVIDIARYVQSRLGRLLTVGPPVSSAAIADVSSEASVWMGIAKVHTVSDVVLYYLSRSTIYSAIVSKLDTESKDRLLVITRSMTGLLCVESVVDVEADVLKEPKSVTATSTTIPTCTMSPDSLQTQTHTHTDKSFSTAVTSSPATSVHEDGDRKDSVAPEVTATTNASGGCESVPVGVAANVSTAVTTKKPAIPRLPSFSIGLSNQQHAIDKDAPNSRTNQFLQECHMYIASFDEELREEHFDQVNKCNENIIKLDRDHRARTTQFVAHNEKLVEGYDKEMARINGRKNDLDKQLISMEEKYRDRMQGFDRKRMEIASARDVRRLERLEMEDASLKDKPVELMGVLGKDGAADIGSSSSSGVAIASTPVLSPSPVLTTVPSTVSVIPSSLVSPLPSVMTPTTISPQHALETTNTLTSTNSSNDNKQFNSSINS